MKNFIELLQSISLSPQDGISINEFLSSAKRYYRQSWEEIRQNHREGYSGRQILKQLSEITDILIEGVLLYALYDCNINKKIFDGISLCALGGYGRRELSPHSDYDLCFLHKEEIDNSVLEPLIQSFTTMLWDLGLHVSISIYTVPEALQLIEDDSKTYTSYLHIRNITGQSRLSEFLKEGLKGISQNAKAKVYDIIFQRIGTAFAQSGRDLFSHEPDIKENAGGLRDYHALLWILGLENNCGSTLEDLEKSGYVENNTYLSLVDSLDFLWKIRNELHFIKNRNWDLLTVEMQYHLSQFLNYGGSADEAIERFMEDYYSSAMRIRLLFEYIARKTEQKNFPKTYIEIPSSNVDDKSNYILYNGYLTPRIDDNNWFVENPVRIMELFWEVSRRKVPIGYTNQHWIQQNLHLINDSFRNNDVVSKYLLSICSKPFSAGFTFREMEKLGVLSKYIPEFGAIQGIVRYKDFHSYPVNEHILRAIESLENIPRMSGSIGEIFRKVLKEIEEPQILVLSILLHDLGKVEGESHIEAGVHIARTVCDRLGLSDEDTEHVSFLVRNHQLMVNVALYRDIDDTDVVQAFASEVKTEKILKELMIMSYADLFAVGPNVWNEWKGSLLVNLYFKTLRMLKKEYLNDITAEEALTEKINQILEKVPQRNRSELEYHLNSMGSGYLDAFTPDDIIIHLDCLEEAMEKGLAVRCWSNESIGMSYFVVATRDKQGLFAQIAGCFASQLIDIYSASLYTREDGWVMDYFLVRDAPQRRPLTEGQIVTLEKTLRSVILEGKDVQILVDKTKTKLFALKKSLAPVQTYIHFDNDSSNKHTVIDIETGDRTGLLYDIASAFFVMGLNIYKARINTGAYRVRDSFYVQFRDSKITHRILQSAIRAGLLESIDAQNIQQEQNNDEHND
ncbi:MAG: [protein-PII] uridylyltransferase [Candidatus Hydrogenedens sp.]